MPATGPVRHPIDVSYARRVQQHPHVEVELKLRVPLGRVDAVEAALRTPTDSAPATDIDLVAEYHDTDDWQLSRSGFAWRMRREGPRWVQALKARIDDDDTSRFEHEVDMGPAVDDTPPPVDPAQHDETEIGSRFVATVARLAAEGLVLRPQFRVVVHRLERIVTNEFGTVAVALDRGAITAGGTDAPLVSLDVCEVEFELVAGTVEAVRTEASRWAQHHDLVADLPNKARRGRALADAVRAPRAGVGTPPTDR